MANYPVKVEEDDVKAAGVGKRVSTKKSNKICKKLNRMKMKLVDAKNFTQKLANGEEDIKGKSYNKAAEGVLEVLENAEANAEFKGIPPEKLRIKSASAEPGRTIRRRRRRRDFGSKLKNSNLKIVLEKG